MGDRTASDPADAAPDPTNPLDVLRHRISDLHWRWGCWKQLFMGDEDRNFGLMDSSAMYFFAVAQEVLFDDVVLRICKLADPPEQCRRENLTIEWLIEDAQRHGDTRAGLARSLLEKLRLTIGPLKSLRNRAIGHEDLRTTLRVERLDPIKFETVDHALSLLVRIAPQLEPSSDTSYMYNVLIARGDGKALLASLADAQRFRHLRLVLFWLRGLPGWAQTMKAKYPALPAEFDNLPPAKLLETLRQNEPWPGTFGFCD